MTEREQYPNAPVVLVALEFRHPTADLLTPSESRALRQSLREWLPIERQGQMTNVQLVAGQAAQPEVSVEHFPRFTNRESTVALSLRREALVIEATDYPGWESFRDLALRAVAVRMEISPVVGIERVGLRYIDEIRVGAQEGITWSDWVHTSLLGPRSETPPPLGLSQWQGIGIYGTQPGLSVVLRYGPRVGYAVDPSTDLRRVRQVDPTEFFLMDIDSYWTPDREVPEYDATATRTICEELHAPIRNLFEGLITERLRDEVLRRND